jgi:amino acid adenylation domain-containing protein
LSNQQQITGFRLSPLQQRIWRLEKSGTGTHLRSHILIALSLPRERSLMEAALMAVARDHEILRTEFVASDDGMVVQRIADKSTMRMETVDLPETGGDAVWKAIIAASAFPSAVSVAGERRAIMISDRNSQQYLYLDFPAIIADRSSLLVIARECIRRYAGLPVDRAGETLQYADIAEWKHALLETEQSDDARSFWHAQAADPSFRQSLVCARKARVSSSFLPCALSGESLRISPVFAQDGASPNLESMSLACWIYLCSQYSEPGPIVLGVVSDSRMEIETKSAVGPMTASLPISFRVNPSESFAELCARVSDQVQTARGWQDLWAGQQYEEGAHSEGQPLFNPLSFEYMDESPDSDFQSDQILQLHADTDRHELKLSVAVQGTEITLRIEYDSSAIEGTEALRLLGLYRQLLAKVMDAPQLTLSALAEYCESLALQAYRALNGSQALSADTTGNLQPMLLHQLFEQQARMVPHAIAIADDETFVSYAELNRRANRTARFLLRLGLGAEKRVGILLPRSIETFIAVLAVLKAGAAFVPLDSAPEKRLESIAESCQLCMLLTEKNDLQFDKRGVRVVRLSENREEIARLSGLDIAQRICCGNLAYVLFTSGSTGAAKGVMVPHEAIVNYLNWARHAYDRHETSGSAFFSPLDFDFTMTAFFLPLACGRTISLAPQEALPFIAESLSDWPGLTFLKLTPAHLRALQFMASMKSGATRLLVIGGEALTYNDLRWLGSTEDTVVVNEYGPSEAAVGCCVYSIRLKEASNAAGDVPIGRPIWNARLELRTRRGALALPGAAGEIWIGGKGVARGYMGRPDLTAAAFQPDPNSVQPGSRCYRTGDLARLLPDNNLVFLERMDDQVKLHGFRIELNEIAQVARQYAGVHEAVALLTGESRNEVRIALLIRTMDLSGLEEAGLRAFLAQRLPAYMVPAVVATIDSIPFTPHGKVDRKALASRVPSLAPGTSYAPPVTHAEKVLAEIWKEVLNRRSIGVNDNFFSAGGDSIRSIQVLALAKKRGLQLSLATILEEPTIRGLAAKTGNRGPQMPTMESRRPFMLLSEEDRRLLPPDLADAYPMTRMQEGMIFHSEWNPAGATYHDIVGIHLQAVYVPEALVACLRSAVERHPVLRTIFKLREFNQPLQVVVRHADVTVEEHDLRGLSAERQQALIEEWMAQEKVRRFDWSNIPPYHFCIHRRGQESFQFSISFHHALLDGWSTATLLVELVQHYSLACGLAHGEPPRPPESLFRDYVLLEQQEQKSKEAGEFWRGFLEEAPVTLYGRLREGRDGSKAGVQRYMREIAPEIHHGLVEVSRQLGVPVKTVLLAGHLKVVSTLANLSEVVTGLVTNGRVDEVDGERVLGLFLNTLPMRFALSMRGWRESIRELYAIETQCARYRRMPVTDIFHIIGTTELFDTAFNFVHYHLFGNMQDLPGIRVLGTHAFEETNFALLASFAESGRSERLTLLLDADSARVSVDRLPAIADLFDNVLRSIVFHPKTSVLDLPLLSPAEESLLRSWAIGEKTDEAAVRVERQVLALARAMPDKTALVSGETHLSYRELSAYARRIAGWLAERNIGLERVVVLDLDCSPHLMLLCMGTLLSGAAYLYLDRNMPWERRRFILRDCNPGLIITDKNPAEFADYDDIVWELDRVIAEAYHRAAFALRMPDELDAACYLVYTSGSTGEPKGIVMTHRPVAKLISWQVAETSTSAPLRTLQYTTLSFDVAFQEIYCTWCAGGTLVLMPEGMRDEPQRMWDHLRQEEVERLFLPCAGLKQLTTVHSQAGAAGRLILKEVITAGDVLHLTRDLKFFFSDHSSLRLVNHYGPAETHVVTAHPLSGDCEEWPELPPIGKPIAGAYVSLLNDRLVPVPAGSVGEIYLGGDAVSRGYLNRPNLTAERFMPDTQTGRYGGRLYRTGDHAGFLADGALEFLGRKDHQVKVRGHRIELGEIETVIASCEGIAETVVIAQRAADGENKLICYAARRGGMEITAESLRDELRRKLPAHMVPARFVNLESLPKTVTGKIDRKSLPRVDSVAAQPTTVVLPANPLEAEVLELWKQALQQEALGVEDDFFDAGGHSLTATRIVVRLRARFNIDLPIKTVFELRTVRGMAVQIREMMERGFPGAGARDNTASDWLTATNGVASGARQVFRVKRVFRGEDLLLAPQQENWWRQELRTGSMLPNNVYYCIGFKGRFNALALEQSLGVLHIRHEALRTAFVPIEAGGCVVKVAPPDPHRVFLNMIDLSYLAAEQQEEILLRIARQSKSRPMDLTAGELCQVSVVRLATEDHVIVFRIQHLVCDGWSIDILANELTKLYTWFIQGAQESLPEVPFQYVDFAQWQYDWITSPDVAPQLAYWMRLLRPPWPDLFPPTTGVAAEFDTPFLTLRLRAPFVIAEKLTELARKLARENGCTLFSTVLAAVNLVLFAHLGQSDIRVGTLAANRDIPGAERVVGLFTNVICLRTSVGMAQTFSEFARQVHDGVCDASAHQELPFDILMHALQTAIGAYPGDLFQVMFFWQPVASSRLQLPGTQANVVIPPPSDTMAMGRGSLELIFNLEETPTKMVGAISWKVGRFQQEQIKCLAQSLEQCLALAGENPRRTIRELSDILNPGGVGAGPLVDAEAAQPREVVAGG